MSVEDLYPPIRPTLDLNFARSKSVDPRITFSRASAATYYDGKTVAKAEENLLTYSQGFESWTKGAVTVVDSTTTAPDGAVTADKLVENTVSSGHFVYNSANTISGLTYTFSVYAKAAERSWLKVNAWSNGDANVFFDLATGVIGTKDPSLQASITSVGDDWYRCSVTKVVNWGAAQLNLGVTTGDNVFSHTGDGASGLFVWGAQIEQRSQVTAYTPTTTQPITNYVPVLQTAPANVPRIDHDPITGECKGLLIEEQRTNLLAYSEQFSVAPWVKSGSGITPNTAIAPDGTLSADTVVVNQTSSFGFLYHGSASLTGVTTSSIYAKKGSQKYLQLLSTGTSAYWANFDLEVGTAYSGGTASASIVSVGDGWYRCVMSVNDSNQFTIGFVPSLTSPRSQTSTLNTFAYIWGAQMEAGSFPTSYIKTEASQVTRAADSASMTGANFSSWYRQDEGTLFANYVQGISQVNQAVFSVGNTSTGNDITLYNDSQISSGLTPTFVAYNYSDIQAFISHADSGKRDNKLVGAYSFNNFASSMNGSTTSVDVLGKVPDVDQAWIGRTITANAINGHIKRITYYPKRLTDAQLQALTT